MDNHYGGVIWTNHALERLRERGIKQGDAWATWRNPQESRKGTVPGSWVYYRNWSGTQIEVVAKKVEKPAAQRAYGPGGEWLILSVWSKPVPQLNPVPSRSSFWKNIVKLFFSK